MLIKQLTAPIFKAYNLKELLPVSLPAESIYVFQGQLFSPYVDIDQFKTDVEHTLGIVSADNEDYPTFYSRLARTHPEHKTKIDELLFENIFYGQLKNVFVNKISSPSHINTDNFKETVKLIIKNMNYKETISSALYDLMSEERFYLMDQLYITTVGSTFLAGYDHTEQNGKVSSARFMMVEVVLRDDKKSYFIAGIDINFEKQICLVMIRNLAGIERSDEWDHTVMRLYNRTKKEVLDRLGIKFTINADADREGMYKMCKELDAKMLADVRSLVEQRTNALVNDSTNNLFDALFADNFQPTNDVKKDFKDKLSSQLLGAYIQSNPELKDRDMVKKARQIGLVGFPTKIVFLGNRGGKGSTGTQSATTPVATSPMFHSLYTDFNQALLLQKWAISWFWDYTNQSIDNVDVVQTAIHSTKNNFLIVFLARRHLNKGFIYHVVRYLSKYRQY